ncbi:uncharacterized protein LOC119497640 isoform X4 [Sebastes umbrosus]|uniref:uncharacterized protein LOC119497640 isoform X4 n=1 Tax=Sebastes umbrosus TaxID=72105 RepID=UPI0018A01046|nr:uncharacterized protein LOC119497640 isoform X4 [Sebastes umbrosus]
MRQTGVSRSHLLGMTFLQVGAGGFMWIYVDIYRHGLLVPVFTALDLVEPRTHSCTPPSVSCPVENRWRTGEEQVENRWRTGEVKNRWRTGGEQVKVKNRWRTGGEQRFPRRTRTGWTRTTPDLGSESPTSSPTTMTSRRIIWTSASQRTPASWRDTSTRRSASTRRTSCSARCNTGRDRVRDGQPEPPRTPRRLS